MGAHYSKSFSAIIGYTYVGAMYLWRGSGIEWKSYPMNTGHLKPIKDLSWSVGGEFIVTTSHD